MRWLLYSIYEIIKIEGAYFEKVSNLCETK
jgi:hypothetical protein